MNVSSVKTALSPSMRESVWGSLVLTNCGRKARKKIDNIGLRMLIRTKASQQTLWYGLRTADLACLWEHATVSGCGDKQPRGAPEMKCLWSCPIKTGRTES